MLNEVRSRLMNVSGSSYTPTSLGEPVSADYVRAEELPAVTAIKQLLYGVSPDAITLDWRTRQLLWFMYASDVGELLSGLDSRVTYNKHSACSRIYPAIVCKNISTGDAAQVIGAELSADYSGIAYVRRELTLTGSNAATVRQITPVGSSSFLTRNASGLFAIEKSSLQVKLPDQVGSVWRLETITLPRQSAGDLLDSIISLGDPVALELFGVGSTQQSGLRAAYDRWQHSDRVMDRLSAILVAIVLQTGVLS